MAILTLATLMLFSGGEREEKAALAQQLLREISAARDSLPLASYIEQLQKVVHLDRRNAQGYHQLGLAWAKKGTLEGRTRALEALERALALAPDNSDFRYALAQLQIQRNFEGAARHEFKKMMALDPADARPYYHLALFKEEEMLANRDKINFYGAAAISFYSFAVKDYQEAERLLRTAIALDPLLIGAYYHLAGIYFEAARFQEMADLLNDALTINADRPSETNHDRLAPQPQLFDLYLLLGFTQTRLQQPEKAQQAYERAFAQMPAADRDLFYSLATVLSPDSLRAYLQMKAETRAHMAARFWQARDPLFLTGANERLLEHFSRMAYANLRFSLPLKKIAGWKTDRGQTLIRFGFPRGRVRTPADLGSTPTGRMTLVASKEMWDYGDFYILYEDRAMSQNYAFAWSFDPNRDGKNLFEQQIKRAPERFDFPHGGKRLNLPHVIAQFRAPSLRNDLSTEGETSDSTLLEIYYGLPARDLAAASSQNTASFFSLQRGLFLCDSNWKPILQKQEERRLRFSGAPDEILIERWTVRLPSGNFNLALEARDQISGHSGAEREAILIEDFSAAGLHLSSILLAKQVTAPQPELVLYKKGEVSVIPSLSREFAPGAPVYVYYEVYNLQRDEAGNTHFRVENTISPAPAKMNVWAGAVKTLSRWLGADSKPITITSAFETRGATAEEKLYHAIELTAAEAGDYRLTIAITDLLSQQRVWRALDFTLYAAGAKK